jgi:hypothetical protein
MANVKKRDGRVESFNNQKIKLSVLRAGADDQVATEIASKIPEDRVTSTKDVRKLVFAELVNKDLALAKNYEGTRRLTARKAPMVSSGMVRITEDNMSRLDLKPGEAVELKHGNRTHRAKAQMGSSNPREINLSSEDMKALDVADGVRIAVKSPMQSASPR